MAGRNKTLMVSAEEIEKYVSQAKKTSISLENQILWEDAFVAMDLLPDNFADLIVVDPPYNLTKNFSSCVFREMKSEKYEEWLDSWISKLPRLLKDGGSVYICSDWKSSLLIPQVAEKYFVLQNRISWEREKGRGAKNNWKNCLEDIWFFTKSKDYKFNLEAVKVLRPVIAPYHDGKGNPKDWFDQNGTKMRLTHPSNIWTDISVPFWSMSENTPHPTQKP